MPETDWNKWAAIGQIAGALGSFAAVATALYLARREERPKLRLNAGIRIIIGHGDGPPYPEFVVVTIRNTGLTTAHINQFGWRTGSWRFSRPKWLTRQFAVQTPGQTGMGFDPPYEVPPGQSRSTFLRMPDFLAGIEKKKGPSFFAREWPRLGVRRTSIFVTVHLESGITVVTLVEKDLVERLWNAEKKRSFALSKNES